MLGAEKTSIAKGPAAILVAIGTVIGALGGLLTNYWSAQRNAENDKERVELHRQIQEMRLRHEADLRDVRDRSGAEAKQLSEARAKVEAERVAAEYKEAMLRQASAMRDASEIAVSTAKRAEKASCTVRIAAEQTRHSAQVKDLKSKIDKKSAEAAEHAAESALKLNDLSGLAKQLRDTLRAQDPSNVVTEEGRKSQQQTADKIAAEVETLLGLTASREGVTKLFERITACEKQVSAAEARRAGSGKSAEPAPPIAPKATEKSQGPNGAVGTLPKATASAPKIAEQHPAPSLPKQAFKKQALVAGVVLTLSDASPANCQIGFQKVKFERTKTMITVTPIDVSSTRKSGGVIDPLGHFDVLLTVGSFDNEFQFKGRYSSSGGKPMIIGGRWTRHTTNNVKACSGTLRP